MLVAHIDMPLALFPSAITHDQYWCIIMQDADVYHWRLLYYCIILYKRPQILNDANTPTYKSEYLDGGTYYMLYVHLKN